MTDLVTAASCGAVRLAAFLTLLVACHPGAATAATWSAETHQIAVGDFNQDGLDDLLLIARSPDGVSGIVLATSAGLGAVHQTWTADYLGIPWANDQVVPIIGNFNGTAIDRRDDVFLQRSAPGLHYLSLTDPFYKLSRKDQAFANRHLDLTWSGQDRRIVSGDFDGDGRTDLYLQPRRRQDSSALVLSDSDGRFETSPEPFTWPNKAFGGLKWSLGDALVYAGDFNGDGRDDLLVQARASQVPIFDFGGLEGTAWASFLLPVQRYEPNAFGIAWSLSAGVGFSDAPLKWNRRHLDVDWAPSRSVLHVDDFNGDAYDDVFLQPRRQGDPAYIVFFGPDGEMSVRQVASPAEGWDWSTIAGLIVTGDFDGDGVADLYFQAATAEGDSHVVHLDASAADGMVAAIALPAVEPVLQSGVSKDQSIDHGFGNDFGGGYQAMSSGFQPSPGSAVGAIQGEFSVDPTGAATYRIPITVPPGVAGMAPQLALVYNSRGPNSFIGPGWSLTGLSAIARCAKTFAQDGLVSSNDDMADGVDLDEEDRYCLDGARLQLVQSSTTEYRTEVESFQRIKASGTQGNGPATFVAEDSAGLKRTYGKLGSETDALVLAYGTSQALIYAVKRIEDGFGNFIEFDYLQDTETRSSFVPQVISYGRGSTAVASVEFEYSTRPDTTSGYIAGAVMRNHKRLERVITYAGSTRVREFVLEYGYSPTTNRSLLTSVFECERTNDTCLEATSFDWQTGARGFTAAQWFEDVVSSRQQILDVDGNGIPDYVFERNGTWRIRKNQPKVVSVATGVASRGNHFVSLDYNGDGYGDFVQYNGSTSRLEFVKGGPDGVLDGPFDTGSTHTSTPLEKNAVAADINGDGLDDIVWAATSYLRARLSTGTSLSSSLKQIELTPAPIPSPCTLGPISTLHPDEPARIIPLHFDSDGVIDLLVSTRTRFTCPPFGVPQYRFQWRIYSLVDGDLALKYDHASEGGWIDSYRFPRVVDINGDGLSDILFTGSSESSGWKLFVSDGAAYQQTWSSTGGVVTYQLCSDASADHFEEIVESYDSDHCPGRSLDTEEIRLDQDQLRHAVFLDYDQDGRTDVLVRRFIQPTFPPTFTPPPFWLALRAVGDGFSMVAHNTGTRIKNYRRTFVLDVEGDGRPDIVSTGETQPDYWVQHMRGPMPDAVTTITNGMLTEPIQIQYTTLTDKSVYRGPENDMDGDGDPGNGTGGAPEFPYSHMSSPISIVKQYQVPDGQGNVVHTLYHYRGAKLHRQGYGFVGFAEVSAWNDNAATQTINRYMQRFPWTGMVRVAKTLAPPAESAVFPVGGAVLTLQWQEQCQQGDDQFVNWPVGSVCAFMQPGNQEYEEVFPPSVITETINTYGKQNGGAPRSEYPYVVQSVENRHQPAKYQETKVEYEDYDNFGNPLEITVSVRDGAGGNLHTTETINSYHNDVTSNKWCPGRLLSTTVTHKRAAYHDTTTPTEAMRLSSFEYDPTTCMLMAETIEPDEPGWQTTTYQYDAAGNRKSQMISADGLAQSRTTTTTYQSGTLRFPQTSANALAQSETYAWDGRHGVKTSHTDSNNLTATWTYDGFGRLEGEVAPQTTISKAIHREWCGSGGYFTCQATTAVFLVVETSSGGQQTIIEFDGLQREVLRTSRAATGSNIQVERAYDPLGREFRVSMPYRASTTPGCWTLRKFDFQNRVTREWSPEPSNTPFGSSCTLTTPPDFDDDLPSSGRLKKFTYDHMDGGHIHTIVEDVDATTQTVGRKVTRVTNVMGRLLEVFEHVDSTKVSTFYDYDAQGNNTWVKDPDNNVTTVQYTARGFKKQINDPNMGTWTFVHNGLGELTEQTDARGIKICQHYDDLGRLELRVDGCNYAIGHSSRFLTDWQYDSAPDKGSGKLAEIIGPYTTNAQGVGQSTSPYRERYEYDGYGRPQHTVRRIDGDSFWYSYEYDDQGRVETLRYPSTAGDATYTSAGTNRHAVVHEYNTRGALSKVSDAGSSTVYWELDTTDALGNVTGYTLGNGIEAQRAYDPATGLPLYVASTGSGLVQEEAYEWDLRGNLKERRDNILGGGSVTLREKFEYDTLDRLTGVRVTAPSINGGTEKLYTNTYSKSGRLESRQTSNADYTDYAYGAGTAGPHSLTSMKANGSTRTYTYDANGNQLTGDLRTLTWNARNLPTYIARGNYSSTFTYGPEGSRYKHHLIEYCGACCSKSTTTVYAGGLFEQITKSDSGVIEYRHYLQAGGTTIAVHTKWSSGSPRTEYLHQDHLGSVVMITNSSGGVVDRLSYDPWGKRRHAVTTPWLGLAPANYLLPASLANLKRGYTGHEHLDGVGLIHMNGRVYDPETGRFLSADPLVQFPESTQGLDRYSYVHNNPLSFTDPSGHELITLVTMAVTAALAAGEYYVLATIAAAAGGYLATGTLQGAFMAAASAAVSFGIGNLMNSAFTATWTTGQQIAMAATLHGLAQGTLGAVQGGKFGAGFLAGAFGSAGGAGAGQAIRGANPMARFGRIMSAAAVGGTASKIGGGKFANGALSGAFVQAFGTEARSQSDDGIDWEKLDADASAGLSAMDTNTLSINGQSLMAANSLPQGLVDFAAGFGDGAFNVITLPARLFSDNPATLSDIRSALDISGGVSYGSTEYQLAQAGGNLVGGAALYGGAALRYVPALGPSSQVIGHPAYGGRTVNALRRGYVRGPAYGRDGGPVLRLGIGNRKIDIYRPPSP